MRIAFHAVLATSLFIAGCDTINVRQYCIAAAATPESDRTAVRTVLASVAETVKLTDRTSSSPAANTLAYYTQPEAQHFAVELGARATSVGIAVDLFAGFGPEPAEFRAARSALESALAAAFVGRVKESSCDGSKP